jgi:hypothetical protein
MTRSKRVREVFLELKRTVGDLATTPELLQAAADLVELLDPVRPDRSGFDLRIGGLPFERWSLDVAMADGGWRVLNHEKDTVRELFDGERDSVSNDLEVQHWMMEHAA